MMKKMHIQSDQRLIKLASKYNLPLNFLQEYHDIFQKNNIPVFLRRKTPKYANRIVMVSTHGYWGNPPPAGVPDTGGQTYYVLEVSKAWALQGKKVIILARWFNPYPQVEVFAKNLWLIRIPAGSDEFVRKEDIYPLVPELAERAVAVSALFGAHAVMGHYADGMTVALEVGERLQVPAVVIPHSLGINKIMSLGFDPNDPEVWFDEEYNFETRESFEIAALKGANFEIANTSREPEVLKDYYGFEFPHLVMPAGAGKAFFDVHKNRQADLLSKYNLVPQKYLIYFGRFSEAKNIPGAVEVFGEAHRLDSQLLEGVKLVLVGGSPENPSFEEANVENHIRAAMKQYGLTENDVVRLPSQSWQNLSIFAHHSLCYIGMQIMEPFGMGVAEAMAASAPVIISRAAGITKWINDGREAIVVNPDDSHDVAQRLIEIMRDKVRLKEIADNGYRLARNTFRWEAIARQQGEIIDSLCQGKSPPGVIGKKSPPSIFSKRNGRAYHRSAFTWRGDPPVIKPNHKKAAEGLLPYIIEEIRHSRRREERVIVALGGESGAGKTEIAEYLRFLLRMEMMWGTTIAGDTFFKLAPAENHSARLDAYVRGELDRYLGPSEVNLEQLDSILGRAVKRKVKEVFVPSDCRRLGSRRYTDVPVDLAGVDVIFVDLTYSLLLKNAALKVFLESDYQGRIDEVKERNLGRDPDQDFQFILKVLEIEHRIIRELRKEADLIVTKNYEVRKPGKK
ncbi:MAG: glycosyltransferase [Thermodesulfobacteriota bacterium]|nr:glycosyltransferase [Thermodesulfobacteriota bacterium]